MAASVTARRSISSPAPRPRSRPAFYPPARPLSLSVPRAGLRRPGRLAGLRLPLTRDRRGTSAIEYAFMAAMVAVIIGVYFLSIGSPITPIFNALNIGLAAAK